MASNNHSSYVSRSKPTPCWLPVLLACFLLQTLIPSGYMPGNLSSGESALVFCGDTAFLDPHEPDISELLEDSDPINHGTTHENNLHSDLLHNNLPHNGGFSETNHCLFAFGSQTEQSAPVIALPVRQFTDKYERVPKRITASPSEPNYIRPQLRAPPHILS